MISRSRRPSLCWLLLASAVTVLPAAASGAGPTPSTAAPALTPATAPDTGTIPLPKMLRVRGGHFSMGDLDGSGSDYERPARTVTVAGFAIGKYEVTFDEWDACHRAGGCSNRADDQGWGRGRRPVIGVSWHDAQEYVRWLSRHTGKPYRLPSEAEWEYLARAGTTTRYSWGDGSQWVCTSANVFDSSGAREHPEWNWSVPCDDGHARTAPVGSYPPNPWGIHDLHGNVWEWVQDCWHPDYRKAPTTSIAWLEQGQCSKRVNRGGGWGNHPRTMRSASRDADVADGRSDALGFRVARDLPPATAAMPE